MRIDIVTLFPELCDGFLSASILGRARAKNLFEAHCHQIRDYTKNKQKQTDDYPYGGGCGMVLYAQPIADCLRAVQKEVAEQGRPAPHIVFLTAGGQRYTEEHARRLAEYDAFFSPPKLLRRNTAKTGKNAAYFSFKWQKSKKIIAFRPMQRNFVLKLLEKWRII